MMVTVLLSPAAACLGVGFRGRFGMLAGRPQPRPSRPPLAGLRRAMCATGSPPKGLSVKSAMAAKATRNRPSSTASACIAVNGSRNRRLLRSVFCPSGVLSSSAVSVMNLPESTALERYHDGPDSSACAARKSAGAGATGKARNPPTKRAARGPPFSRKTWHRIGDQFAALLAGLSIAALSPVAGAAGGAAVDLMPCSRSAAVFSALSSLASGGT